ncbi:MAG: Nitrogen-fixing NifU domain-containing protein [Candidatus Tokpelaia sp. JSC161]|jgi:NifU-like protein involved in Fe-S cluster formation|nr:MAG: Nitrogen-fixing NifU domain-containing protein [Candidatus Tokpelaia sp. JSC161]
MITEIYNHEILRYASYLSYPPKIKQPDAKACKHSKLCGSTISVELKMENGIITDFSQKVHACVLGQASASIMAQNIIGVSAEEIKNLKNTIRTMLEKNGPTPKRQFSAFSCLQVAKPYKTRHASIMLVFDAITDCIEQIEKKLSDKSYGF